MNLRRRSATRALLAAALLALVPLTPATHASSAPSAADPLAATPDTSVVGTDEIPADQAPTDGTTTDGTALDPATEIVQSWTLTTGGENGGEAGSRPNFTYQVQPGAVIEDSVVLYNLGNVPMQFRVYATDAFNNADGQFDLIPGDEVPVGAGSWVQLVEETIVLGPGQQAQIPFTLTVPVDAAPGDHVGAVVAGSMTSTDTGSGQVVDVERRTGTRLYVQVDGELTADLAVSSLSTSYGHAANPLGGDAEVSFSLENRGNVRLGGTPVISVGGPFGLMQKEITLDPIAEILPGQTIDLTASLDGVPALFLNSTEVRLDIDESNARGGASDAVGTASTFAPPITLLLVLAVVVLGLLARRAYRRRTLAALPVVPGGRLLPDNGALTEREPQHQ